MQGENCYRPFDKYLEWFPTLLSINAPLVVFIQPDLLDFVKQHRPTEYPTIIIKRPFEDLHAYKYFHLIQGVIDNMRTVVGRRGRVPDYYNHCPEFINAKYEVIIFSKFDFLKEVAKNNPYSSKYFVWLDAGIYRNKTLSFDSTNPWPDPYKMKILENKFLVPNEMFDCKNKAPLQNKTEYLRGHYNEVTAYMLGGCESSIYKVCTNFWNLVNECLQNNVINNEQHLLQLLILESPNDYHLWDNVVGSRLIPTELAMNKRLNSSYATDHHLKLLTVASKNIQPHQYTHWEQAAKYYGYNYEILGRDVIWTGFKTKILLCRDRLKTVTEPIVVITDCTDLFPCASSIELTNKFYSMRQSVIIGGEAIMWYNTEPKFKTGQHPPSTIHDFFVQQHNKAKDDERPPIFPNGGFIIGDTRAMFDLLTLISDYDDDQAAYHDVIYENKFDITVDYRCELVGNVPNYHMHHYDSAACFTFDEARGRYRHHRYGTYPMMFHFPGQNYEPMNEFYRNIEVSGNSVNNSENNNELTWVIIVVLTIVFVFVLLYIVSRLR
jgi:hypothetical protein